MAKDKLPPVVPGNLEDLDRAITLLGNRVRNPLGKKARKRLVDLVGTYPDEPMAQSWKDRLTVLRTRLVDGGIPRTDEMPPTMPEDMADLEDAKAASSPEYDDEDKFYMTDEAFREEIERRRQEPTLPFEEVYYKAWMPPLIPSNLVDLERAIALLSLRAEQSLARKKRLELVQLLDAYPDAPTAMRWKAGLCHLKTKLTGEEATEDADTRPRLVLMLRKWDLKGDELRGLSLLPPEDLPRIEEVARLLGRAIRGDVLQRFVRARIRWLDGESVLGLLMGGQVERVLSEMRPLFGFQDSGEG